METLKREEIYANRYEDLGHMRVNIEEFIDRYYNRQRQTNPGAYARHTQDSNKTSERQRLGRSSVDPCQSYHRFGRTSQGHWQWPLGVEM